MASIARKLSPRDITSHNATSSGLDENLALKKANGTASGLGPIKSSSKYRHIAAVHSTVRNSCLSRDAEPTPSFLGFRNLMVIVLSTYFFFFIKANDVRKKYLQPGLIKSSRSCNEPPTGRRKLLEGKNIRFVLWIDINLTGSSVWGSDMYPLP